MRFDVLTLLPEYFQVAQLGVTGRAFRELGHGLHLHSYRPFSGNAHGHVDAPPYGGGPGMVLRPEVLQATLTAVPREGRSLVVHFSPAAPPLDHAAVVDLATFDQLILVCSRFEGVDQRAVAGCIDREYRVGEAVLSGGELPALILIDAVLRWLPGVLGNAGSAEADSFATGLLDHPHFTRPEVFEGLGVPEVLLGGNHEAIRLWRLREAMARTRDRRPDLWEAFQRERLPDLSRSDQWCAWQVLHPEAWGQPKPKGWKGLKTR